jgi:hypothetical protein
MIFKKFMIAAASVAAVTATIIGAASASASAGSPSHTEHFLIMSTSNTSDHATIIGTGNFIVAGTVTGDFADNGANKVVAPGGSFRFIAKKVSIGEGVGRNCLTTASGSGTYKISGGTGKYAGISGSGKFVYAFQSVDVVKAKGGCGRTAAAESSLSLSGPTRL